MNRLRNLKRESRRTVCPRGAAGPRAAWPLARRAGAGSILLLLLMMPAFASFTGCKRKQEPAATAEPGPVRVRAITATAQRVPEIQTVVGTVQSRVTATVSAKILAAIEQIPVKAGDRVRAGDLLAQLDDRELRADFERAKADYDRFSALLKKDAATRAEFDAVQARFRVAQANLSDATIRAPFEGIVTEKLCDVGDLASPGKRLFTLEQPAAFRLEASVPERFAGAARPGAKVRVTLDAIEEPCDGVVGEVVPVADPSSRSVLVKVDLGCRQPLKSGLFGRAHLVVGERTAVCVPHAAVRQRGQLTFVFVAAGGRARMRLVKPGKTIGEQVELLAGLQAGERVVVGAEGDLADGQIIEER